MFAKFNTSFIQQDVELGYMAKVTQGFSGADLTEICQRVICQFFCTTFGFFLLINYLLLSITELLFNRLCFIFNINAVIVISLSMVQIVLVSTVESANDSFLDVLLCLVICGSSQVTNTLRMTGACRVLIKCHKTATSNFELCTFWEKG